MPSRVKYTPLIIPDRAIAQELQKIADALAEPFFGIIYVDESLNISLGKETPEDHGATVVAIEVGANGTIIGNKTPDGNTGWLNLLYNCYWDDSTYRTMDAGVSCAYETYAGEHDFLVSNGTDTEGGAIVFLSPLYLDNKGNVIINKTPSVLATTATDGFLFIPTCSGIPTGVPSIAPGSHPIVLDQSNNDLYFYNSGWKKVGGVITATTTELEDVTDNINTSPLKIEGYQVFNSTTNIPVWATGNVAGNVWVNATGATAHTPV